MDLLVPPHSSEAEHSVLGALLLDNEMWDRVADVLSAEDFYHADHRAIYSTIGGLINACRPADVVTVHERGSHELAYLNDLAQSCPLPRNARAYAMVVREHAIRRAVIGLARGLEANAFAGEAGEGGLNALIDEAVTKLLGLWQAGGRYEPKPIGELIAPFIDTVTERAEGKTDAMPTGLTDLDRLLAGGVRPGELVVLGARPSMGKSALSLTIARNMAQQQPVLVCSMEDSSHMLVARQVAAAGRINLADIRLPPSDNATFWRGMTEGIDALDRLPIYIDEQPALALQDVRRKIAQVKRQAGRLGVVIVDYLQLMQGKGDNRHQVLGAIAAGLKATAKEQGVAVILLSQLNREADKTSGPPRIDHLRESGGIEEAADIVWLLWREARNKPKPDNKHKAQVEVVKQKNGATDTVHLHFDGATQRFSDRQWEGH